MPILYAILSVYFQLHNSLSYYRKGKIMKLNNTYNCNGFTLVELAIVFAIMGMLLAATIGLLKIQYIADRYKATKTHLIAAKEAIISYAMSHGRLPYTDRLRDGYEDKDELYTNCQELPCYLPWMTLLFNGLDPWGQRLRYDVNNALTTTNNSNICAVLYEISLHQADTGANTVLPCVTSTSDTNDNGQIDTDASSNPLGRSVAAIIISDSELAEGASYPNLTGKNADTDREYEMEATGFDKSRPYNDQVAELTINELMSRLCSSDNTFIKVYGGTGNFILPDSIEIPIGSGNCINNLSDTVYATLKIGQSYKYYEDNNACMPTGATIFTGNFTQAAELDFVAGDRDGMVKGDMTDF